MIKRCLLQQRQELIHSSYKNNFMKHVYFLWTTWLKLWCTFIFFGKNISCENKVNKICKHSWIWGEPVRQLWWGTLNNSVCQFGIHLLPEVHSQTLFHERQQHFLRAAVPSAAQYPLSDHNSDWKKERSFRVNLNMMHGLKEDRSYSSESEWS